MKNNNYPSIFFRSFCKGQISFYPSPSRLPDTPIAPFSGLTPEVVSFLDEVIQRDNDAIYRLQGSINNNQANTSAIYNNGDVYTNHDLQIESLNNITAEDYAAKKMYEQSANLAEAICDGNEPPIHNTNAWLSLKNDLDNSEVVGIGGLKEYVQHVYDTKIRDQWVESISSIIGNSLPENRSEDNNEDNVETDQPGSTSESDSPDSSDNPPATGQALNPNNNQSDVANESNSNINQSPVGSQPSEDQDSEKSNSDVDESNASPDKKLLTDDALDISETLRIFFD